MLEEKCVQFVVLWFFCFYVCSCVWLSVWNSQKNIMIIEWGVGEILFSFSYLFLLDVCCLLVCVYDVHMSTEWNIVRFCECPMSGRWGLKLKVVMSSYRTMVLDMHSCIIQRMDMCKHIENNIGLAKRYK